jgi:hypothetical protein
LSPARRKKIEAAAQKLCEERERIEERKRFRL